MSHVLLVDDDTELTDLLREYLESEGYQASAAADGQTGCELALSGNFDIVILDVMMPRMSGIEVLRRIRGASQIPVVMLTARGDNVDRIVGLELGADDYVPKPCLPRELVARIRAILRRTQSPPSAEGAADSIVRGPLVLLPARRHAAWNGETLALTSAEFNLLELLVREAGRVVDKGELSEAGLGRPLARYDRSVDVHLSSIRRKLAAHAGVTPLIQTVRGFGYQYIGQ